MSTEIENTEVKELQELEKPSHESIAQDSEYKIFDYFKEHTQPSTNEEKLMKKS